MPKFGEIEKENTNDEHRKKFKTSGTFHPEITKTCRTRKSGLSSLFAHLDLFMMITSFYHIWQNIFMCTVAEHELEIIAHELNVQIDIYIKSNLVFVPSTEMGISQSLKKKNIKKERNLRVREGARRVFSFEHYSQIKKLKLIKMVMARFLWQ